MKSARVVCILGAESTGKTTLAQFLAAHFACPWVPEHLRTFCEEHQRTPLRAEQSGILQIQHAAALAACTRATAQGQALVVCDTAPLLTAIYSDWVFGDASLYSSAYALHALYDLTLLLAPDLPWVPDGLQRDGPQVRQPVDRRLQQHLGAIGVRPVRITGQGRQRSEQALKAVLGILQKS